MKQKQQEKLRITLNKIMGNMRDERWIRPKIQSIFRFIEEYWKKKKLFLEF